ncbi:hypothetical protein HW115_12855 [Verrucomicrobiaceae bacterium N1E253]|uniref:BPL/LPL catalytic domain-containing protein n=1 Tax=Oceaniferula marina TaxID=2748318 RepID=A0A851GG62_9BACT|nr:hypothetical protein [Oceaniferula marina]NWK56503.1 hypothetical protein [Oceaniferula marina]
MAVDQLMMEQVNDRPILRVYHWVEPTVTFGYFLPLSEATDAFPDDELTYVRRWTGGGVVDHRIDLTYTLAVPRSHELASARGAESYRVIHQAVANVMNALGESVRLTVVDEGDGGAACFTNPVAYDLTNMSGEKVAGAGQRRSRYGLLHQGSVITKITAEAFTQQLVSELCPGTPHDWDPGADMLEASLELAQARYATESWLKKLG